VDSGLNSKSMAFLTVAELNTHLYGELVDEITREIDDIALQSINAAISEMKGYLGDFNTTTIFAATGSNRHALILFMCKDIACWHLVCLANPNIDLQLRKDRYERAIDWLKGVQSGKVTPDLPAKDLPNGEEAGENGLKIRWGSNEKRVQHYN